MIFFHGYSPEAWRGYWKNNLIRENTGIRFCQSLGIAEELKFNNLAKKGGELYRLVKENNYPLYVDRLQGGSHIQNYQYDKALIEEYRNMLGERFFGFQMHEWVSNYRHDVQDKLGEISKEEWNEDNIRKKILEKYPGRYLFIESMTPGEMAEAGKPESYGEFYNNITAIYKKRTEEVGELVPCDSFAPAYGFELSAGTKRVCPEVGAQTPFARFQICYARGMTRKPGRSFGVYYEPWGGSPFGTCTYCGNKNEWGPDADTDSPYKSYGPTGGSSRSLQKRVFLYTYLSNAEFISEEWGMYNTFTNTENFELSPYGIVKKEFLDFCDKYDDVGEKLVPAAVVLPKDMMVFSFSDADDYMMKYEYKCEKNNNARRGVLDIFDAGVKTQYECATFRNYVYPDGIDILNRDDEMTGKYDYLVDLTGDADFKEKHNNIVDAQTLKEKLNEALPCCVEGDIHWMVNECTSGGFYLTVFNHSGVTRSVEEGEKVDPESTVTVSVTFKNGAVPALLEGDAELKCDGDKYLLSVKGGSFGFIRF